MKNIQIRLFALGCCFLLLLVLSSCGGNPHWNTSAGVDVVWGPGGARVQPNISVGVYNGGRW